MELERELQLVDLGDAAIETKEVAPPGTDSIEELGEGGV